VSLDTNGSRYWLIQNRVSWGPITTKANSALMKEVMKMLLLEIEPIRNLKGLGSSLPFQLITKEETSYFSKNGSNPLGITEEDGPLFRKLLYDQGLSGSRSNVILQ
jgi:hypothetical protein